MRHDGTDAAHHEPEAEPSPFEDVETYVVFTIDTHGYALPVEQVHHVLPLPHVTRVPTDSPHVLGLFHHGGRILPLWDLHTLFAADGPPPEQPTVLIVEQDGQSFGLLVHQVDEVVSVDAVDVVPVEEEILPSHVVGILAGWLRVPEKDETAEAEEPPQGLNALLAAAGRPDRGAAVLALLAPVHLIDLRRLRAALNGDPLATASEVSHGRP